MNREQAVKIANAVLYEGYMLYPYRPSAIKNRQRWSFGILYPPVYPEVISGTERCTMHSECLLKTHAESAVQVQLRFLHLLAREVAQIADGRSQSVPSLMVDGRLIESWDQGVERSVELECSPMAVPRHRVAFSIPGSFATEPLLDAARSEVGSVSSVQHALTGEVIISSEKVFDSFLKLTIETRNTTVLPENARDRDSALLRSLLSAHIILTAGGAEFVSLLDPPEELRAAAGACKNVGNFPVLVGDHEKGKRDMLLCSPIILYDYPQVAPESAGDFYDATEIDEMLTLRVMTLTDEEKREMSSTDEHVRALLERTEQSAREQLSRTHGAIRSLRPVSDKP